MLLNSCSSGTYPWSAISNHVHAALSPGSDVAIQTPTGWRLDEGDIRPAEF